MKLDAAIAPMHLTGVPDVARAAEQMGFDCLWTQETQHNPFLPCALIAEHTEKMQMGTAIAVSFARSPGDLAYTAWDLAAQSNGRFILGLGTQVKGHIEKRFGVGFSPPAARMREYIQALKAIFDCWQHGAELDFQGEYYRHTLMTPMFNPGPLACGPPPVLLGALGPRMTEVAGEVADGLIVHPFNSMPFLTGHALPAVQRGLAKSGRERDDFTLQINAIVITGETDEACAAATESVKSLLGFYASTPAYRPPMDAVGYGDLQPELNRLSKEGRWAELGALIDQEFLDAFTTSGRPEEIAGKLLDKYGDHADRLAIYAPYAAPDAMWRDIISDLKQGGS